MGAAGDGFDDMIIGASSSDVNGQNTGAVYIMLGSTINNRSINTFEVYNADYRLYGGFKILVYRNCEWTPHKIETRVFMRDVLSYKYSASPTRNGIFQKCGTHSF